MNPYAVAVVRAARCGDLVEDNQEMILGFLRESMLAERRRARLLYFEFIGFIAKDDHQMLLQDFEEWQGAGAEQEKTIERNLEIRLRAVLNAFFEPIDHREDELNLTAQAWKQIVFHIPNVTYKEIRATSVDGLHRIRLRFCKLPEGGPSLRVNIRYAGPLRFRTFDTNDEFRSQGGILQEYTRRALPRGLNDHVVFESWYKMDTDSSRPALRP